MINRKKTKDALYLKPLHYEALKLQDELPEMADIRCRNVTPLFIEEINQRIKKGNLLNMQIRGEQTSGKSLVGFVLVLYVNSLCNKKTKIEHICPDQFDFANKIKDRRTNNECFLIDEWNELSTTGYNASTNQAFFTHFNEVQAQRYYHKIGCSPEKVIDPTSRIRLDVLDKDPKKKITTCLCSYVLSRASVTYEQPIGIVEIDVSTGLNSKLWQDYRKRKFMRMDMLNKKGIIDSRQEDEAEIILKVVEEMRELAIVNGFVQRDIIRSYIQYVQTKYTAISIWGEDKLTGTIYGILTILKSIYGVNEKISKLEKVIKKIDPGNKKEKAHYEKQLKTWKDSKAKLAETFETSMNYHQDILDTLKKFAEIGEEK